MTDAAADMDSIYRVQRHIYDASRKFYLLGRDGMLAALQPPQGGTVLEIGCGTGRNLILASDRYAAVHFYGIDVSAVMLETARASVAKAGRSDCIRFAQADASKLDTRADFGIAAFDRVFVSYALSMIPPWREALWQAYGVVKPGGSLHIVDFGEQTRLPGVFRTGLRAWLKRFSVEPRAELEAEVHKLAEAHGACATFARPFRDYACSAVIRKPAVLTP
jgi:S-adenosylmethionine-diacylgycerolhomoserine-N-methlytransferase